MCEVFTESLLQYQISETTQMFIWKWIKVTLINIQVAFLSTEEYNHNINIYYIFHSKCNSFAQTTSTK